MTAGTGVVHSEYNPSATERLHLLQIWIMPDAQGHTPRYHQKRFGLEARKNVLLPVVSGKSAGGTLMMHQDATLYVSDLEQGKALTHTLAPGRRAYLFLAKGAVDVVGARPAVPLRAGDAAVIEHEAAVELKSMAPCELVLMDLP